MELVRFNVFTYDVMNNKINGYFENLVIIAHVSLTREQKE